MPRPRNTPQDVWKRVEVGDPDECWTFIGAVNTYGYGQMRLDGKHELAHRIVFRLSKHDPGELLVCHSCDNRRCCNPAHLFLGTVADNYADAKVKGRHTHGERHPAAKLRAADVLTIRALAKSGTTFTELARRFGVTHENVSYIVHRRTWRHI